MPPCSTPSRHVMYAQAGYRRPSGSGTGPYGPLQPGGGGPPPPPRHPGHGFQPHHHQYPPVRGGGGGNFGAGFGGGGGGGFGGRRAGGKFMSADEVDHIMNIMYASVHTGHPYAEDYYYQV